VSQPPNPSFGVCVLGHSQRQPGAQACYHCGQPIVEIGGPTLNDRYQILSEIGRGGLGSVVYRVQDLDQPGRILAIKEMDETKLRKQGGNSEEDIRQLVIAFKREADTLNELDHANIVKVYEYFSEGTKHYMAMDLVDGRTIGDLLDTSPDGFPEVRVLPWAEQLCSALDYLHHQTPPIIYRDMKPDNVMIQDTTNSVKMIDFGIARQYKGGRKKQDTIKFGTMGYAAPEQYGGSGTETSPTSDVYSLAAMLYQLLTGEDPADNPLHFFDKSSLLHPAVGASPRVADALEHALQTEIAKRCKTMGEFMQELTGRSLPEPEPVDEQEDEAQEPEQEPEQPPAPLQQPPQGSPVVHLSTDTLNLGKVRKRATKQPEKPFQIVLKDPGRVQIEAQEPWIRLSRASIAQTETIDVSVIPSGLPAGHYSWKAPNFFAVAGKVLRRFWWLVIPAIVGTYFIPWGGVALVLALIAALGTQLVLSTISLFMRRVIARKATLQGDVTVGSGDEEKTLTVSCTVRPSLLGRIAGWLVLIVVVAAQLFGLVVGCVFLFDEVLYSLY
jgi:serine/threonine-protein kinase